MRLITLGLLVCLPATALAHDLWIERADGGYILYSGHKHSAHEGAEFVEYASGFVTQATCFDAEGRGTAVTVAPAYPARIEGACPAVVFECASGYWSKTPYGTRNAPKNEATQVVASWLSFESAKRLERWSPAFARSLTLQLEIAPQTDPFLAREGDKLELLVTYQGKPAKGAIVTYDGKPRGTVGDDGRINIRLRHGAFQSIAASLRIPLTSEKADEEVHTTHLTFELVETK
jgi:nickel transport protein